MQHRSGFPLPQNATSFLAPVRATSLGPTGETNGPIILASWGARSVGIIRATTECIPCLVPATPEPAAADALTAMGEKWLPPLDREGIERLAESGVAEQNLLSPLRSSFLGFLPAWLDIGLAHLKTKTSLAIGGDLNSVLYCVADRFGGRHEAGNSTEGFETVSCLPKKINIRRLMLPVTHDAYPELPKHAWQ